MRLPTRTRGWSVSVATLVVAAGTAIAVALVAAAPVAANNDPHRIYLAAAPFDVPATVCGFAVHVESLVDREYAKVTTNPDGSTTYKITGTAVLNLTNSTTGKTITVNASGPGKSTFSADGTTLTFDDAGLTALWATNLMDLGAPSNFVVAAGHTAGTLLFTTSPSAGSVVGPLELGNVLVDVCGALS
jgi:hypothetical protein